MSAGTYAFKFNDKKRNCATCGKRYKPKAPNQKHCDKCRRKRYVSDGSRSRKNWGDSVY